MISSETFTTHYKPSISACFYENMNVFHLLVSIPIVGIPDDVSIRRNVAPPQVEVFFSANVSDFIGSVAQRHGCYAVGVKLRAN